MGLDTGWQNTLLDAIRGATASDSRVVAVQAYGSVASGAADAWSDLDVAVRVVPGAAAAIANTRWLSQFGQVWASDASANSSRSVMRVVYADGRRLDLTVADAGRTGLVTPPALDRLAARTTRVRFASALTVVRAARNDLLVATHLLLGLLRDCLELAVLLRDHAAGTSRHRTGGHGNEISARVAKLIAGGGDPGGDTVAILDALDGVVALYDQLAGELDEAYSPDWSGLDALIAHARASATTSASTPTGTAASRPTGTAASTPAGTSAG